MFRHRLGQSVNQQPSNVKQADANELNSQVRLRQYVKCAPTARFLSCHTPTDEQMMMPPITPAFLQKASHPLIGPKTAFSTSFCHPLTFGIGFVLLFGVIVVVTVMGD
jgi:hypothetical protein